MSIEMMPAVDEVAASDVFRVALGVVPGAPMPWCMRVAK